ncbi:MAG: DnaJ domain-containing protein [Armatimonadota bacterium]
MSDDKTTEDDVVVRDPYAILGVSRDASYEIIRRSYREKAKHCHPDLGAEPGREEEFKLLNWAHRVLAEQRRTTGKAPSTGSGPSDTAPKGSPGRDVSPVAEILREGQDRLRMGAAKEAESLARLALQRAREDTEAYTLLSDALSAQSRYAEAIGCLLMALQIDRTYLPAREALTRLQERSERG